MSKTFSKDEVASHKTKNDLWYVNHSASQDPRLTLATRVMVDDDVYDLTKFQEEHPGGQKSRGSYLSRPLIRC